MQRSVEEFIRQDGAWSDWCNPWLVTPNEMRAKDSDLSRQDAYVGMYLNELKVSLRHWLIQLSNEKHLSFQEQHYGLNASAEHITSSLLTKYFAPGATQLEHEFRGLVENWREETATSSTARDAFLHPSYQRIIGLGPQVVPLILREWERQPDHWMWALHALTSEDPARGVETISEARLAWLAWGKENGYLL